MTESIDSDTFINGVTWMREQEVELQVTKLIKSSNIDDKFGDLIGYHDKVTKALDDNTELDLV